uniref:SSD domain-containing protein n=3 Tax=Brugia TaxID=6278 RepID=A0A5S6PMJ0_BRUMA
MEHTYDRVNRQIAITIATYPYQFLFATLFFSAFLSFSLFHSTLEDDIRRSFSPPKSRAAREEEIYKQFYNIASVPQRAFIIFYAKDGGTMLRESHIDEMFQINKIMTDVLNNTEYFDLPICHPFCDVNKPISIFWDEFKKNGNDTDYDKDAIFSFPVSTVFGQEFFLGSNLFSVQSSDYVFSNRSTIIHVGTIMFWHLADADNAHKLKTLQNVTITLFEMSRRRNVTKWINFNIFGDEIANREMIRGAYQATKLMTVGFLFLICFVFLVVWRKMELNLLPPIVFATIFSPLLAAISSFGIISWLRLPIYSMMCVTPFLILGIGVDDAFIMIQSWTNLRAKTSRKERLAQVFIEIGPSISITSMTNLIAFGIGYLTPTPQMSLFCLCTSFACLLDYIFTFTFLAPILYLADKSENDYVMAKKVSKNELGEQCLASYSKLICSWKGQIIAIIILVILYSLSAIGVMKMKSTFEPVKAFPSDSISTSSFTVLRDVFDQFFPLQIVINKPPNISNSIEYNEFHDMIRSLEAIPNSYGPNRTMIFLKTYEDFDRKIYNFFNMLGIADQEKFTPSYDNLPIFLDHIKNPPFIKMNNEKGEHKLVSFVITTTARNMSEWSNRAEYVDACRTTLRNYPHFNATVYDGDSAVLDLILTAKKDLIGSITVTVICMAIVCLFFIGSKIGVLIIASTILSICFTLVGSLSWWGADMDPVTMVDVLIATGFSVDYTAHIAYKFYKLTGCREERIKQSFREMCGPMFQAGISTILCMLPLIFVPTYAILAFAKTVFLDVGLALLHGFFILPILLVTLCRDNRKEASNDKTMNTSGMINSDINNGNLLEK